VSQKLQLASINSSSFEWCCVAIGWTFYFDNGSVADPGCLSRIPDPDFYPSRIPDPKTTTKERGEKIWSHTFFATIFTKLKIIIVLKC
jgi:hypothetical protein